MVYDWLDTLVKRLQAGENPLEDNVPTWYFTHRPEHFDRDKINEKLAKLYHIKGSSSFREAQGYYDELAKLVDAHKCKSQAELIDAMNPVIRS